MKQFVTYLRVSTQRQGAQGLGISAQREMCANFVKSKGGEVVQEFKDVESGTHRDRKGLWEAIEYCKANNVPLVIAKLDRLARDVEFTFKIINTGIEIHFTDMPVVNSMILGVFAAVAQYEREMCSKRTKDALAVKKAQGAKLGASNEKYKQNYDMKTEVEKKAIGAKRGQTRNKRKMECRDTQALIKVLQKVFDMPESVSMWDWSRITLANGKRFEVLELMKTYKEVDDTNRTFATWDFDDIESDVLYHKIANNIHTLKRSTKYFNETILSKSYEETGNIQ